MLSLYLFLHDKTATTENNTRLTVEKCSLFSDCENDLNAFVIEIRSVNHREISTAETIPVQMKTATKDFNGLKRSGDFHTWDVDSSLERVNRSKAQASEQAAH